MSEFSRRNFFDSFSLSSNENDLTKSDLRYGSLRKCYSCSQIQILKKNCYKTKRKSINRSLSSDQMKNSLTTKLLLKMIDFSAIDPNEYKCRYFENPIIKITQNFHNIQDLDHNIDSCGEECDTNYKLIAHHSNMSSTSAEGGSSPADVSPSDYFSHELSESVDETDWETDSNTISCDKTCAQNDSSTISKCIRPIDGSDCHNCSINQKSRTLRYYTITDLIINPLIL